MFVVCGVQAMLLHSEDLFMMGVRLAPENCCAVLYHLGGACAHDSCMS